MHDVKSPKMTNMNLTAMLSDEAILAELGRRLADRRIARELTQADVAERAGIGKRTLERIEAGGSSQLSNLVRVLRALELMEELDQLVPLPSSSPMALLKTREGQRKRASSKRRRMRADFEERSPSGRTGSEWTWGDEA